MSAFVASHALLDSGFEPDVCVEIGSDGTIAAVTPRAGGAAPRIEGVLLPGMTDLHSHAFQRSFAGRTGQAHPGDDFWSWREAMYRAAGSITPAVMRAVAAYLGMRLLTHGYTALVEFHYLFNRPDGTSYAPRTAMTEAIIEGAREAGIALTLLFGVYETGGFGGRPLEPGQSRFANCAGQALGMLAAHVSQSDSHLRFGLAPHSLRAVPPESLRALVEGVAGIDGTAPIHIHVAEQTAELTACREALGAPPVAWLLDHAPVSKNWCLIHATHAGGDELRRAAATGAIIGLCPSTEADLGDGIFDFASLTTARGSFGVGSDSNVCVDPLDELRLLEYAQRLRRRRRNLGPGEAGESRRHTGVALWQAAAAGGAQAAGRGAGRIAPGQRADFCVLAPTLETQGAPPGFVVDAAIFAPGEHCVRDVMVGGEWRVRDGCHLRSDTITAAYVAALRSLG